MIIEFDDVTDAVNRAKHDGYRFIDLATMIATEVVRRAETRSVAMGLIHGRLHVAVTTLRGDRIRVVSLRRANKRERRIYADARR